MVSDFDCLRLWTSFDFYADKDRELGEAQAEIKALRLSERLREKAVEEVILFLILKFILYMNYYLYHLEICGVQFTSCT